MPRTSVLIAAFNAEATLADAVASALAQTTGDLEVIVVDDGSRLPAAEVLSGVNDSRLRVLRHARNRGLSAARNTALNSARAPLVSQLDADDTWEPEYLEAVLPCFAKPDVGLAYANATIVGHPAGLDDYIGDPTIHPCDRFPELLQANPVPALTATMRTAAVRAVGGYASWLWGGQDWHLYMKLAAAGWRFAYVDRRLARYRWPDERHMSGDQRRVRRSDLLLLAGFALRHPLTPGAIRRALNQLRTGRGVPS